MNCNSPTIESFKDRKPASPLSSMIARRIRSVDTQPELLLRRALWRRGLRYRINVDELPGRPDVVFFGDRLAVFCDGDFWHGRDWKSRRIALAQGSNSSYWLQKIQGNRIRDRHTNRELKALGWSVIRLWEGDIKRDIETAVAKVLRAIRNQHRKSAAQG